MEQVIIKTTNGLLGDRMWKLQQDERLTDLILQSGNVLVPCHRAVLVATGEYFDKLVLDHQQRWGSGTSIDVSNTIPSELLYPLIQFIYTGQIQIACSIISKLLFLLEVLCLEELRHSLIPCLQEDDINWLVYFYIYLEFTAADDMLSSVSSEIQQMVEFSALMLDVNTQNLFQNESVYLQLPYTTLASLLGRDSLVIPTEDVVLEAVLNWSEYDAEHRKQYVADLMHRIRFAALSAEAQQKASQYWTTSPTDNDDDDDESTQLRGGRVRKGEIVCHSESNAFKLKGTRVLEHMDGLRLSFCYSYDHAPFVFDRECHTMVFCDGWVYAFSGYNSDGYIYSIEEYSFVSRQWTVSAARTRSTARVESVQVTTDGRRMRVKYAHNKFPAEYFKRCTKKGLQRERALKRKKCDTTSPKNA